MVTVATVDREFAFSVSVFGMPIAEWRYTIESTDKGTRLTEHWNDRRVGRSAPVMKVLGLLVTGVRAGDRATVNRAGMRATLEAIRAGVDR